MLTVRPFRPLKKRALLTRLLVPSLLLWFAGITPALAQTFTTIADGNWSSPATWSGGSVPTTSGNFPGSYEINIRHTVNWDGGNNIKNEGVVRIEPTTGTTARLNVPSGFNVENYGEWYVINGFLIQFRFVGGGNSGTPQSGTFKNKGGLVEVLNSYVEIAQDWTNEKDSGPGVRTFENSCLITGQNFSNSDSLDTLIGASVSIGWHGSGSFQYSNDDFEFQQVRVQLAGTSGNFELNSGNAFGDIDYITLKNHVTNTVGSGKISASSSLTTIPSLNLDAFCAATYESNGKFSGTQTSEARPACPLTTAYFPCVVATPEEPQLTLVKVVTTDDGGNEGPEDFDLNLQGNDGVHNPGVDYQDSGSGVQPNVVAGVEYTVSETPPFGYTLEDIVCEDDDTQQDVGTTFTLADGQNVTCTFTNDDIAPTLTLIKVVENDFGGLLGPDDFGISVGGVGVTSGATNPYPANTPLAINESLPGGYTFVSITGDPECPGALGGTVTLDEGEDVECTITNQDIQQSEGPNIDLAKAVVSGPTFSTATNRWTVVYSVTATNFGDETGSYDLVDTLTPATGISVFAAELTSYDGGSENSQTGTILGDGELVIDAEPFNSGDMLVDDEDLGAGENESWTITVEFEVDLSQVDETAYACILGDESEGAGFYNLVTGVGDELNLDNNDACTNLPQWDINLSKSVDEVNLLDPDTFEVVYAIQAENLGANPGLYELIDTLDPGTGITLVSVELTAYVAGTENSQTGTIQIGDASLPDPFNSGDTLVTNEALAAGLNENWLITAVFDVDWDNPGLENECSEIGFGAGTGFYNRVEGNIEEEPDDNHACTGAFEPNFVVTKTAGDAVDNLDGSYTVAYTILVENTGDGEGIYDLDDTLLVDDSLTLVEIVQGLTYDAGASNDPTVPPQNGTIETVVVADLLAGTTTLLTGERLAPQADETWTIVLRFSLDTGLVSSEGADCEFQDGELGTGFLNRVEILVAREEVDEDDGCTEIPPLDGQFTVLKDFDDDNPADVTISLSCAGVDPGDITADDNTASESDPANFTVSNLPFDGTTCTATESGVPPGYTPVSLTCNDDIGPGDDGECTITNEANTGTFTVRKQYGDDNTDPVSVTASCTAPAIVLNNPQPASPSQSAIFNVSRVTEGTTCTATEAVPDGYTADISDCQDNDPIDGGCLIINEPLAVRRVTFTVQKLFMDGNNETEVDLNISCNTGLPLDQTRTAELVPGPLGSPQTYEVEFVVTDFDPGELDCEVFETPVPGYIPSYNCNIDVGGTCDAGDEFEVYDSPYYPDPDPFFDGPCEYDDVDAAGGPDDYNWDTLCVIRNYPAPVDIDIQKDWVIEGSSTPDGISTYYEIDLYCDSPILNVSQGGSVSDYGNNWHASWGDNADAWFTAEVIPNFPASQCHIEETVFDDAVEVDSGCGDESDPFAVSVGNDYSCTITNTIFFEGIPTLNQYGLALLALLMLGVGVVGFRRYA